MWNRRRGGRSTGEWTAAALSCRWPTTLPLLCALFS
jgi:hypothetical protein